MNKLRWQQRLQNFKRVLQKLNEALEGDVEGYSDLEKEGIVQRFEYTFELAWKTLKDYLVYDGIQLDQITPRHVLKKAFASSIIMEGQTWIDMLEHRNLMSHTYDQEKFEQAVRMISKTYSKELNKLVHFFDDKL